MSSTLERQKLLVPNRIRVGFQNRSDTYTQQLAYVIYYDMKGKIRKETSWQSWRDKSIDPKEFDNVPTEGFVLNRAGGGNKHSYGWNVRNEFIRVYDPRGFEFEISLPNLLFILQEANSTKGKGLEGEFVYAWDGADLVLLPANSEDYKVSTEHTRLQTSSVKSKDLVPGALYQHKNKNSTDLVYVGRYLFRKSLSWATSEPGDSENSLQKKEACAKKDLLYVFRDKNDKKWVFKSSLGTLAAKVADPDTEETVDLITAFERSPYNQSIVSLSSEPSVYLASKPAFYPTASDADNELADVHCTLRPWGAATASHWRKNEHNVLFAVHAGLVNGTESFDIYNAKFCRANYYDNSLEESKPWLEEPQLIELVYKLYLDENGSLVCSYDGRYEIMFVSEAFRQRHGHQYRGGHYGHKVTIKSITDPDCPAYMPENSAVTITYANGDKIHLPNKGYGYAVEEQTLEKLSFALHTGEAVSDTDD